LSIAARSSSAALASAAIVSAPPLDRSSIARRRAEERLRLV
jgi:hypothetical protein